MCIYTDSLCSLQLVPHTGAVGIIIDCSGQCSSASSFQYSQCKNLFNTLGIERCIQPQCNPKIYNLSACITQSEAGINTTDTINQTHTRQCSSDRDSIFSNTMTEDQPQLCTPTTVYRTETVNRTVATTVTVTAATYQLHSAVAHSISCTPTPTLSIIPTPPTSTTNTSGAAAALGTLVALLMLLLIVVTTALVWTSWKLKTKEETKSLLRQSR